jgi:NAD(P)H-hydrate epimerase
VKLLTAEQMRELDRRTIAEVGIPGVVLMENAGRGVADHLCRRFVGLFPGPVLVLAGKGNNGGDGYVAARYLLSRGWQVRTLVLAPPEAVAGDAAIHLRALLAAGGEVAFAPDASNLEQALEHCGEARLAVDALLGTGLTAEVAGPAAVAIDWLSRSGQPVVAVDIPSGVDAASGRVLGRAVRAALTVTFAAAKVGHCSHPGAAHCGELEVVDIGIPAPLLAAVPEEHRLVDAAVAASLLPPRPLAGHKGTFGHLLVVAGSVGKSGAAALAAGGGVRSGAGLVTVACPASVQPVLAVKLTEAMTAPLPEVEGAVSLQAQEALRLLGEGKAALAVGPGLGLHEETAALIRRLVRETPVPLVVDADGLNALAGHAGILRERSGPPCVLTPHPGEMVRLAGVSAGEIEADRVGVARRFARENNAVLLLKGARTVVALPDGRVSINGSGNAGLASGGMGDVLTGLIGGLLAQGLTPDAAAVLGCYLHGLAADRLARRHGTAGLAAGDLLRELPAARNELQQRGTSDAQG